MRAHSSRLPHEARPHGFAWVAAAAAIGFADSFVLSGVLGLSREGFVLGYAAAVTVFLTYLWRRSRDLLVEYTKLRWRAGLVVGVATGALLVVQVFSQPAAQNPGGIGLVWDVAWLGLVYGTVDALLLTVVPVIGVMSRSLGNEQEPLAKRIARGVLALLASAAVTAAYHAGFDEFQGRALLQPVIGNTVITLSYLLSGSPLAPVVAHVAMHTAAVLHGAETTMQLPPHY